MDYEELSLAVQKGKAKFMRDLLVESDCYLDPQAYMLKPEVVFEIPEDEEEFIAEMKDELDEDKYRPEEYGI